LKKEEKRKRKKEEEKPNTGAAESAIAKPILWAKPQGHGRNRNNTPQLSL